MLSLRNECSFGIPSGNLERRGTGEQQIHQAAVRGLGDAAQGDGVLVLDGDLEMIACVQVQLLPDGSGKDDLAFLREHGGHGGKIFQATRRRASNRTWNRLSLET